MLPLLKHQTEGVRFLQAHRRAAIFDEPGLGKGRTALAGAEEPVLIVAPAMLIDGGVWVDEINKWRPNVNATLVAYSSLSEREKTKNGGTRPTGHLKPELRREWGTVILDEAHYVKGRKTNWTLAVKQLRCQRMVLLTGTPLPNWAHEAYTLLQLMFPEESKPGQRLGSYWRWVEEWFDVGPRYNRKGELLTSHEIGDLKGDRTWEGFVKENWRDRTLLRKREDCLDLPPLTQTTMRVGMTLAQAKAYRELKKDFVTWLGSGAEVSAWSQAGQLVKLAMCATGLDAIDPDTESSGKLDALETLLNDRDLPTLVVAHFRSSVKACARRAKKVGKESVIIDGGTSKTQRADYVRAFQRGDVPVLCATIDTISEGLTLNAADMVIKVERSWRPSRNEQVMRRIHRIGQERPVTSIDLVTRGTVDERVLALLDLKTDQQIKALGTQELSRLA